MGRRILAGLLVLSIPILSLSSQEKDQILQAFQKNFIRANLVTKIQVLQDAAERTEADMGPLYLQSLRFVIDSKSLLEDDPVVRELAVLSVRLIGMTSHQAAMPFLWELFTLDTNTTLRVEILNALGALEPEDPRLVQSLNRWLVAQNELFRTGEPIDEAVVGEAVIALGKIGDDSSFPVLFSAHLLGYSDEISRRARESLYSIEGDFKELILRVLRENTLEEKLEALRIALENEDLSRNDKGQIAEIALNLAVNTEDATPDDREYLRQIRYESVKVLTAFTWSSATQDVIVHFNQSLQELLQGIGRTSHIVDAIACLGAMGTHEAAERLALYLDSLNSDVENDREVDEEIALAVIQNLGALGDSVAFEHLLYAGYLDYNEKITKAAREALNKLQ